MIHTAKDLSVVNEAEADVFLDGSYFFCDPADVGNLISGSPVFSKSSLYIWKFSVHILLNPSLKGFEHYLTNMWNEYTDILLVVIDNFFDALYDKILGSSYYFLSQTSNHSSFKIPGVFKLEVFTTTRLRYHL